MARGEVDRAAVEVEMTPGVSNTAGLTACGVASVSTTPGRIVAIGAVCSATEMSGETGGDTAAGFGDAFSASQRGSSGTAPSWRAAGAAAAAAGVSVRW